MTRREAIRRRKAARRARKIRMMVLTFVAVIAMLTATMIITLAFGSKEETKATQAETVQESTEPVFVEPQEPQRGEFQQNHSMDWGGDESYLLAKIAMAEAEGESIEGKAMVIMVVLNRVFTEGFPGTIEEVIFQERGGVYQFSPVQPGGRWWRVEPDEECWQALDLIMRKGWDESEGALYFEATYNGENTWHSKNLEYIKTVGNHNFYK